MTTVDSNAEWIDLCSKNDLIPHSGVAAMHEGQQIALFYIPEYENEIFAVGNNDPFSGSNVLSRGLIGDLQGEPMVASPLYKQHFSLSSGACIEEPDVSVPVWPARLVDDQVQIML